MLLLNLNLNENIFIIILSKLLRFQNVFFVCFYFVKATCIWPSPIQFGTFDLISLICRKGLSRAFYSKNKVVKLGEALHYRVKT